MDSDIAEKMKNILCQDHNKKIQFLNLEMGARTFFICADCLTKNKKYCIDKMDYFVSIEDFKSVYLNRMKRELEQLKENISTTQIQIENHIKNGETNIEDQYENMIKVLTQHIKNVVRAYKQSLIQKFRDAHRTNLKALEVTTEQINMMLDDNSGILKRLDNTMNRQIENSAVLQKLLQEFLDQKKAYQANVDQLKLTSASFSFKDLICEFKSDKQFAEHKNKVLKEKLNSVFMAELGTEDYREAVIHN